MAIGCDGRFHPSLSLTAGWVSIAGLNAWHAQYNKSNFMFFSYDVSTLDPQYALAAARYVGYKYITNETQGAGYSILSPYLFVPVSILASTSSTGTQTATGPTGAVGVPIADPAHGSNGSTYAATTADARSVPVPFQRRRDPLSGLTVRTWRTSSTLPRGQEIPRLGGAPRCRCKDPSRSSGRL